MTMRFILAVAADGEIALVGQHRQQLDGVAVLRGCHFSPVLLNEPGPLSRGFGGQGELHGPKARRQVGKPHIVPILRGEFGLGHTPRRTTHGSDAYAFPFHSRAAEPDDAYCQVELPSMIPSTLLRRAKRQV